MIATVLLDLDDTIFDFKACEKQALEHTLCDFRIQFDDAAICRYSEINDSVWKMLERGEITRERLRVFRFELFLREIGADVPAIPFADAYMTHLSATGILLDGAIPFLEELSKRYRLYAVTNGYEQTQRGRINAAKIGGYFRDIFISQCIGKVKPNKDFFDYCKEKTGFSNAETALVGDSLTSDVKGGVSYGLYTVWFNPKGDPQSGDVCPSAEAANYQEVLDLLRNR